jgi:hypothetical protein
MAGVIGASVIDVRSNAVESANRDGADSIACHQLTIWNNLKVVISNTGGAKAAGTERRYPSNVEP